MPKATKASRPYRSLRRQEQARATRASILDAARELFVDRGYIGTTIQAIADRAGVSPETVFAVFGNKRSLLSSVVDVAIVGDDAPVPLLERDWVQAMREERDPRRRVKILARNGRLILERIAPISEVMRGAASADPQIRALWERYSSQRLAGQRELIRIVGAGGYLRKGLSADAAADTVFALGSPDVYRLLTVDRGWPPVRFERWYADALVRLLLG
jgi:AcrR family transcriptional regulator